MRRKFCQQLVYKIRKHTNKEERKEGKGKKTVLYLCLLIPSLIIVNIQYCKKVDVSVNVSLFGRIRNIYCRNRIRFLRDKNVS